MSERKVCCGVAVVVQNASGQILMGKRKGSHGAGCWSFPGGWQRHGEQFDDSAKRELMEETGLELNAPTKFLSVNTTLFKESDVQSTTILLMVHAGNWTGIPVAKEPDKLDGKWQWFDLDKLPTPLFEPLTKLDIKELLC